MVTYLCFLSHPRVNHQKLRYLSQGYSVKNVSNPVRYTFVSCRKSRKRVNLTLKAFKHMALRQGAGKPFDYLDFLDQPGFIFSEESLYISLPPSMDHVTPGRRRNV